MRAAFALVLLLALLAGCAATQGPFPSLAPRAIERELAGERSVRPAPAVPHDPALTRKVAELVAQARQGQAAFASALQRAQAAATRSGAVGSEGWIAAQLEVTRAEAARAGTVRALAELDALGVARATQPTSGRDAGAITAALAEVQALANRQQEQLDSLRASISAA